MFYKISEEQYKTIVNYAKEIIESITEDPNARTLSLSAHVDKTVERRYKEVIHNYHNDAENANSKEELLIFKYNILLSNNEYFARNLLDLCSYHFRTTNIEHLINFFKDHKIKRVETWEKILVKLSIAFVANKETIEHKIYEILSYPNIYFPQAEEKKGNSVKSLSQR